MTHLTHPAPILLSVHVSTHLINTPIHTFSIERINMSLTYALLDPPYQPSSLSLPPSLPTLLPILPSLPPSLPTNPPPYPSLPPSLPISTLSPSQPPPPSLPINPPSQPSLPPNLNPLSPSTPLLNPPSLPSH